MISKRYKRYKRWIASLLLASLLTSLISSAGSTAAADANTVPELFVSEIHPDVSGTDDYEFFEVYNNSNKTLRLNDYTFLYRYPTSTPDIPFTFGEKSLAPEQVMVFWYNNTGKTLADFNTKYGVSLDAGQIVEVAGTGFSGFHNTNDRTVAIKNNQGVEISKSGYTAATDIAAGLGDHFKLPASGTQTDKFATKSAPTPGTLAAEQIPSVHYEFPGIPVNEAPIIDHTPVTHGTSSEDLTITAQITDVDDTPTAALFYKNKSDADYASVPMGNTSGTAVFTAVIPKAALTSAELQYYIQASDSIHTIKSAVNTVAIEQQNFDFSKVPVLLITELVPDTTNVAGVDSDAYEFVELYNNTTRPISLKDYQLIYRYTNSSTPDAVWSLPASAVIPPLSSSVFWIMNGVNTDLTADDFNANYKTALVENTNLFKIDGGGGMANGGMRKIIVASKAGKEIAEAYYANAQTDVDKGIFYQYPTDGTNRMSLKSAAVNAATPGSAESELLPAQPAPAVNQLPVIEHVPPATGSIDNDLTILATIADPDNQTLSATLYYRVGAAVDYQSAAMTTGEDSQFSATIPKEALTDTALQYYIQASDGVDTVKSSTFTVSIELGNVDFNKLPPLMVTEIVPDSTNVGTGDGYEFVEVYNNTDQTINFKNYKIQYRYTDSGPDADVIWPTASEELLIPSKKTMVFWVINSQNKQSTVADFNKLYGTNLVEGTDIVKMYSDGMANGGKRGIVVASNTKTEISAVYYDNDEETVANKGIFYKYSPAGSTQMMKYSAGTEAATPGKVAPVQVPIIPVKQPADTTNPTFNDLTGITEIDKAKNLQITAEAQDENKVKSVALYYKSNLDSAYTKRYLEESFADTLYHYTIYSPELIGRNYLEYYYVISDGKNEVTSEKYRVNVTGNSDHSSLRLNVKDGEILAGTKVLKGTSESAPASSLHLSVDQTEVTNGTYAAVEQDAYFAFEANGVNYYFKNGVAIGKEALYIFEDPINSYTTLTVPIAAERLKAGNNIISIRAGTKASPFDDRDEENKDDFTVRNVRLVFADGTEIFDERYKNRDTVIPMGDSAGKFPVMDFNFVITDALLASKAYALDTTKLPDGEHAITVGHSQLGEKTVTVKVDNTAPTITTSMEEGKLYRGPFTIHATVQDALSGLNKAEVWLDEAPITLPYKTSSKDLTAGNHVVLIHATDKVGNRAQKQVTFSVPDENPTKPELVTPASGSTGIDRNPVLTVKVADPMNDKMNVSFFQGFKYDAASQGDFQGFRNAAGIEPPKEMVPAGESAMTPEDYNKIGATDGQYLIDDSTEQFPYQRFQVQLDASVKETDKIELSWKGNSLEGRKVSMYAWSPAEQKWKSIDSKIAGAADFTLGAWVTAGEYAVDHSLQVMVQDELPVSQEKFDFSFAWMSDTQYYSESYPRIYEDIVNWIADNKESQKIKYVIHTGDIVDEADKEIQWERADADMKVLENANIPYGVLAGNHDVDHQLGAYDYYWKYFGEKRFKDQPTYGGSLDNNRGHYDLVSSNGNDFIMVYMGWGVRDSDIDWMNEVLAKYPNRKAILNFHEFLLVSGNRAPIADKIFEKVVTKNKNVFAVLSGHYHNSALLVDELDDNNDGVKDRKVYQMLSDYQGGPEGGQGYIKLLQFDMANDKMYVKTYSPYLDDYNFYDPKDYPNKDEFTLDVDLTPQVKRVATDYMGVNVYTDQLIGKEDEAGSGEKAGVTWSNLDANKKYQWYALAEDAFTGQSMSEIWNFTTGTTGNNPPAVPPVPPNSGTTPEKTDDGVTLLGELNNGKLTVPAGTFTKAIEMMKGQGDHTVHITTENAVQAVNAELLVKELTDALKLKSDLTVSIDIGGASYSLPLDVLDLAKLATTFGADAKLVISIAQASGAAAQQVKNAAASTGVTLVGSPVEYTVSVQANGKSEEIKQFGSTYISRTIVTSQQLDPKATTAVMYNPETGAFTFVPATFKTVGGQTIVTIQRNGNSIYAIAQLSKTFSDVSNHWARADIELMASKLIVKGSSGDQFGPDQAITRAEFAAMIVRALGMSEVKPAAGLSDVRSQDWFAGAVGAAVKAGLVKGYQDGSFKPNASINREEMAVIIARAIAFTGKQPSGGEQLLDMFKDKAAINSWAKQPVAQAVEAGIINGMSNGNFVPGNQATRAEAAVMLKRLLKYVAFIN
ncbi:S-layer homology domain-containing protein [Paenibacillus lignilyticus]|uniref:S-layer homology domain-containing protein n=1 Tax=Paenibacillus lignilyticus TaxID=1172615 RepID=A0ABS5CBU1_9BACL|nr:S-layer homology domain-containing protein [Paenibacillus lignilyticus]MBP3963430.1 S-layer homology domain-containing protein [Paenibacillus lignilyticus]